MKTLAIKRLKAFALDYLVILAFIIISILIGFLSGVKIHSVLERQLLGFVTLTLPVFLYFYLSEISKSGATFGKRFAKISVKSNQTGKYKTIFIRNFIKFLPWEIAHIGLAYLIAISI